MCVYVCICVYVYIRAYVYVSTTRIRCCESIEEYLKCVLNTKNVHCIYM